MASLNTYDSVPLPRAGSRAGYISERLTSFLASIRRRRALHALGAMEDHVLDDIGVNRADINWALNLPLRVDAARELDRIARARRLEAGWLRR